jgi:hypothetical protein
MSLRTIDVDEDPRSKLCRSFVARLKADPVLANVIKKWDENDGRVTPHEVIPPAQMPAIRFSIAAPPMSPATFASHSASIALKMEIFVAGNNMYDMIDLWGAIEKAAGPFLGSEGDRELRKALDGDPNVVFGTHHLSETPLNYVQYSDPPVMVGNASIVFVLSVRR